MPVKINYPAGSTATPLRTEDGRRIVAGAGSVGGIRPYLLQASAGAGLAAPGGFLNLPGERQGSIPVGKQSARARCLLASATRRFTLRWGKYWLRYYTDQLQRRKSESAG